MQKLSYDRVMRKSISDEIDPKWIFMLTSEFNKWFIVTNTRKNKITIVTKTVCLFKTAIQ